MKLTGSLGWKSAGVLSAAITAGTVTDSSTAATKSVDERPNIIVMMVDDMGFSDPGCYGGEINTPNIDNLAARGVRFTRFNNCARCCPTRASLLTGLYPHQVGLTRNGNSLTRDGMTIPEALRDNGYETGMFGKWHLSDTRELKDREQHMKWLNHQLDYSPFAPVESYPINRGFNKFYGVIWGVIDHFDPFSLVEDYLPVKDVPEDYYFADAITDKAIEFVKNNKKNGDKPFFMYYAHCAPHWPIHAKPEDIEKYKDTYTEGWEKLRKDRYARQQELGLFGDKNVDLLSVMDNGRKWDELPADKKEYEARKMAVHAGMIDCIDQNLGRLIETLKETGEYENTMIIFLSDNGASPENSYNPGFDRPGETRDGEKLIFWYEDCPTDIIGSEKSYIAIAAPWASAANTPFKYWKKESYEGGSNTPCIISWPKGLKAKYGSITDQPAHVMDIMPTCLELTNTKYPKEYKGHKLPELGGNSLTPIMEGKQRTEPVEYYFEHEMGRAVRTEDWKLVAHSARPKQWHLYHISEDITETYDVADKYPEKVKELKEAWITWAKKVKTLDFYRSHLR